MEESFEKSSESSSEGLSDVGEALLDAAEVIVADVVATLPVAAVSGTALPAEQVMSGTPFTLYGQGRRQETNNLHPTGQEEDVPASRHPPQRPPLAYRSRSDTRVMRLELRVLAHSL